MLRPVILTLAKMKAVQKAIMSVPLSRKMALRFVAGEEMPDALRAAKELNERGFSCSLDHLGEGVEDVERAREALGEFLEILDHIRREGLDSHISVKPTDMGLAVDPELCREQMETLIGRAQECGTFVRIDMEGSEHTQATIALYEGLCSKYENVGVAVQSYLYRTREDIEKLLPLGGKFRLCKGAYNEPPEVAFPAKGKVDENYLELSKLLLESGTYHGLATHDEAMIRAILKHVAEKGIPRDSFEFQMLYGVRRDLQEELVQSHRVRIYVPYGREWYPYLMRRLGERPANLLFILKALIRG